VIWLRFWRVYAALALLAASACGGGYLVHLRDSAVMAKERQQVAEDARKRVEQAEEMAFKAEQERDKARRALAEVKPKVVERVRQNPSGCILPRPVTDSLREQARKTNEALRSVAGDP
jgi:membrane-bound lytic murein transglycosylase B